MRTALSIPFVVGLLAASAAAQLGAVDNSFDGLNLLDKITALKEPNDLDFDKRGDVWVAANGINGLRKKKPKKQSSASGSLSAGPTGALKVVDTQMDLNAPNAGIADVAAPAVAAAAVTTVATSVIGIAAGQITPAYQPVTGPNGLPLFIGAGHDQPTPTFTPDSLDALKSRLAAKVSQLQATPDADLTTVTIDARSNRLHDGEAEFPHLKRGNDDFGYKADDNGNIIAQPKVDKVKSKKSKSKKPSATASASAKSSSAPAQKILIATNALAAANKAPIGENTFAPGENILVAPAANTAVALTEAPVYNTVPGVTFVGFGHDRPTPTFVPSIPTGLLAKPARQRMAKVKREAKEEEEAA